MSEVSVYTVSGITHSLHISSDSTALSLKEDLCDVTGLTCSQQVIMHNSAHLDDDQLVAPVMRSAGANKLLLLSKIRGGTLIHIQPYSGPSITMEVDLDYDTIEVIKNKIEEKKGIAKETMLLVFKDETLEDSRNLRSYGIQANETIHLVSKASPSSKTSKSDTPSNAAPQLTRNKFCRFL